MNIIIYPNNEARPESNPSVSMGTNEDYGIPDVRPAIHPKGKDDVEYYFVNGHRIKAFFTTLDRGSRAEYQKKYNQEYQRITKGRNYSYYQTDIQGF
jgi:hypothetical protein